MAEPFTLITTTALITWATKNYGKSFIKSASEKAIKALKKHNWRKDSHQYCKRIEKNYGNIQVLGMNKPMLLEGLFTDVHILKKMTKDCHFSETYLKELKHHYLSGEGYANENDERKSGDEIIKKYERLFVIGKPGAGKTTYLKHIAIKTVDDPLDKLSIFISLREFANSSKNLLNYIVEEFNLCGFPEALIVVEYLLNNGKAVVLFDGLDEVEKENNKRDKLISEINNFGKKYSQSQIIISCRIAANEYQFEGFQYVEMADFNESQITDFVRRWFKGKKIKHKGFIKEFQQNNLKEMAKQPLLLVLLCLTYEATMTLPPARAELYEVAVDTLLREWDSSRIIHHRAVQYLTVKRMRKLFEVIAAENFQKNEFLFKKKVLNDRIEKYIETLPGAKEDEEVEGKIILNEIEANSGILVERAKGIHSFSHLTFQEYFTASYIVRKGDLAIKGLFTHLTEDNWNEVFLLSAQMLDDDDSETFFTSFLQTLSDLIKGEEKINKFLNWARKKASSVQSKYSHEAVISHYASATCHLLLNQDLEFNVNHDHDIFLVVSIFGLSYAIDRDMVRGFTSYRDANYEPDPDLFLDYKLNCALDVSYWASLAAAYPNAYAYPDEEALGNPLNNSITIAKKMGISPLVDQLKQLKLPIKPNVKENQTYTRQIQTIMIEHRDIGHDWKFSPKELDKLTTYLKVTKLLVDCLNVAAHPNRKKILSQILKPPS